MGIFLDQQRTKWLNKTATKPVGVAPPKGNQGGKPAQGRCADPKLLKNIVGRHIKVHRGQEKLLGALGYDPSEALPSAIWNGSRQLEGGHLLAKEREIFPGPDHKL